MLILYYHIEKQEDESLTIEQILQREYHFSNRLFSKLIRNGCILKNNISCDTRQTVKIKDILTVDLSSEEPSSIVPTPMQLSIVYEDEFLLILNKPAGIAIHPSMLHYEDSLSNGVQFYFNQIGLKKKIRAVNRLDLNTSGLVIFAKCDYLQEALSRQMQTHIFHKEYLAICEGIFEKKEGIINEPIARKETSIIERCVNHQTGQPSITCYQVLAEDKKKNISVVKCILKTGRTHQIRVHMAHLHHPLLGDSLYGNASSVINRQSLHSHMISFYHPILKQTQTFTAPIPQDMKNILKSIL